MPLVSIRVVVGDFVVFMILLDMLFFNRIISVRVELIQSFVVLALLSLLFFDVLNALGIRVTLAFVGSRAFPSMWHVISMISVMLILIHVVLGSLHGLFDLAFVMSVDIVKLFVDVGWDVVHCVELCVKIIIYLRCSLNNIFFATLCSKFLCLGQPLQFC